MLLAAFLFGAAAVATGARHAVAAGAVLAQRAPSHFGVGLQGLLGQGAANYKGLGSQNEQQREAAHGASAQSTRLAQVSGVGPSHAGAARKHCQCILRPWHGSFSSAMRKDLMEGSNRERPSPNRPHQHIGDGRCSGHSDDLNCLFDADSVDW